MDAQSAEETPAMVARTRTEVFFVVDGEITARDAANGGFFIKRGANLGRRRAALSSHLRS
jgi:hypothetical protein